MWALPAIIGVAVAGAVVMLVVGVVLAVSIERRRHRKVMQTFGHRRGLSTYHRPHLSASGGNYMAIPEPRARPRSIVHVPHSMTGRSWTTIPSDEYLTEETILVSYEDASSPMAQGSIYGDDQYTQIYAPPQPRRTRRQKKIARIAMLDPPARSPLSAITELSDSNANKSSDHVEASAETIRKVTPEHKVPDTENQRCIEIPDDKDASSTQPQTPQPCLTRLNSTGSISVYSRSIGRRSVSASSALSRGLDCALPLLPITERSYNRPIYSGSRASSSSIGTIGTSFLRSAMPPPPVRDRKSPNQGLHDFDFGLDTTKSPNWATVKFPPRTLQPGLNDDLVGRTTRSRLSLPPAPNRIEPRDSLKVIDASGWSALRRRTPPRRKFSPPTLQSTLNLDHRRHSMLDCDPKNQSYVSKHRSFSPPSEVEDPFISNALSRPASVATTDPMKHLAIDSSFQPLHHKGHRRQNCVRITNLTPITSSTRLSKQIQMPDLQEEPTAPYNTPNTPPQHETRAHSSLRAMEPHTGSKELSGGNMNTPLLILNTPRLVRPESDNTTSSASETTDGNKRRSLTSSNTNSFPTFISVNTTPSTSPSKPNRDSYESPTLPSPILASTKHFPRQSRVRGPRTQPPSHLRPHGDRGSNSSISISPLRGNMVPSSLSSVTTTTAPSNKPTNLPRRKPDTTFDLRRSVMMLRSMNSEAGLADTLNMNIEQPAPRNTTDIDFNTFSPRSANRLTSTTREPSTYFLAPTTQPTPANLATSTTRAPATATVPAINRAQSTLSITDGPSSIWEDVSIHDPPSSEPHLPTPTRLNTFRFLQPQSPSRANSPGVGVRTVASTAGTGGGDENGGERTSTTSPAKVPGVFDRENRDNGVMLDTPAGKGDVRRPGVVGLGLYGVDALGQRVWETPGSLYDGRGFLKE